MRRWGAVLAAVGTWGGVLASPVHAQARLPAEGGFTTSLGQPGSWDWSVGAATGVRSSSGDRSILAEGRAGVYRELVHRVLGVGGVMLEGYSGAIDTRYTAGVRARVVSPVFRFGAGLDHDFVDGVTRPIFSYVYPWRRGGLFRDGSVLRIDLIAGRDRAVEFGIEKPVFRRIPLGSTRPLTDRVHLKMRRPPAAPLPEIPAALRASIDVARDAALAIQRLCVPFLDHTGGGGEKSDARVLARLDTLKRLLAAGEGGGPRSIEAETRRLHAAIDRAFSLAIAPSDALGEGSSVLGRAAGERARAILLAEVLLPYNRLLGQVKDKDTTRQFAVLARGTFLRWLHVESEIPRQTADAALAVFTAYAELAETVRGMAHREWGMSRFTWIPLQLALHPEQHDTQAELDALVAQATGEPFSDGNVASYVINEQFQYQLSRTIREARDYHVLLTHDFRGYDAQGDPDEMSFRHVMHSYLAAMTAQVKAYDSTGRFPVYMIILDEWFYSVNRARLWMDLLEDPLRHRVRLPARFEAWEDSLGAVQDSLRAAVERSPLLSAHRRQYGEGWLHNLVKVHVNITNASDPTFASWIVATNIPVPDNWMRDHRKVVLYDLTEEDPYRGEALITGAGVGEHYANLSWEDRSLLMRGPAVLGLKKEVRELLIKQGIPPDRVPAVLQPRPRAEDYDEQVRQAAGSNERTLRALLLQNGTGFDRKDVNVAKAVLYTLMPPGSVIKVPDSLWNGTFWGSALVGCALRGVRVLVIAPALANAPARAFGSMIRARELLWRLLMASRQLAPEIAAAGGLLKVGIFATDLRVNDIPGKVRAVRRTLQQHQWLHDLFAFPEDGYPGLDEIANSFGTLTAAVPTGDFESRDHSLLHLKANFFASREAWTVMARSDWVPMTVEFVQLRMAQVDHRSAAIQSFEEYPDALLDVGSDVLRRWHDGLSPAARERVIFYTVIGSANQNDRSMVTDGEDALVLSNWPSVIAYIDLISLVGQSRWIEEPAELDALIPRQSSFKTRLAHWFKLAF